MKLLDLQRAPAVFRSALLIDTDGGPQPLADALDDWQDADFRALDSGWQRAIVGSKQQAEYQRAWLERPRGHSKTLDLAVMAAWALFASRRRLSGIAAAGDQDQARLLRDAVGRLVYVNPWLAEIIEVQNYRVINPNTGSTLEIISSDAPTSYGLTPDFVVADEVTHWKKRDLWDSLISSAAKRSTCMFVVIANAGLQDDWQWETREAVRTDPNWYFSRLDGPQATWITSDRLTEQERLLPSIAYRRLWLNEWTTGGGDALAQDIIRAAFVPDLKPHTRPVSGYEYVAGLDLGVSRDASAVCILGVRRSHEGHGRIRLAFTRIWKPIKGQRVNLQEVEDTLFSLHRRFAFKQLNYDPWQAEHMASRLQAGGLGLIGSRRAALPMVEITSSGSNLQAIASTLIQAFNDYRLELFDDPDLKRDLYRLRIEERSYGFRLTSPRDEHGHGDMATAFGLAMLAASELAAQPKMIAGILGETKRGRPLNQVEREIRRIERNNEIFQREQQQMIEKGHDHNAVFRQVMRMTGRR